MVAGRRLVEVAVLALAVASPAAAQKVPAWTYTTNITFDSGGTGHKGSMAMRYQVTDNYLRTEFVQVAGSANPSETSIEGTYTVMSDRDSSLLNVMPSQKAAMIMPNPTYGMDVSSLGVHTTFTRYEVKDLGPSEKIMGHPTRHYQVTTEGAIEMKRPGGACTMRMDGVEEFWYAQDLTIQPAMEAMLKHYTHGAASSGMTAEGPHATGDQLPKNGVALRTRMSQTKVGADGKPITVTMTSEYVELSNAPVDESLFHAPAGYHVMDMRKMMARLPQGMLDSVMQAGQEKASAHSGCE